MRKDGEKMSDADMAKKTARQFGILLKQFNRRDAGGKDQDIIFGRTLFTGVEGIYNTEQLILIKNAKQLLSNMQKGIAERQERVINFLVARAETAEAFKRENISLRRRLDGIRPVTTSQGTYLRRRAARRTRT